MYVDMGEKLYWENGDIKWYALKRFDDKISTKEAENLPKLDGLAVFRVENKKENINDLVLINDNQEVLKYYTYSIEGIDQMTCFINILKIQKHYDESEGILH